MGINPVWPPTLPDHSFYSCWAGSVSMSSVLCAGARRREKNVVGEEFCRNTISTRGSFGLGSPTRWPLSFLEHRELNFAWKSWGTRKTQTANAVSCVEAAGSIRLVFSFIAFFVFGFWGVGGWVVVVVLSKHFNDVK